MPTSWVANSCQCPSRRRRGPAARVDRNSSIPAKIDIEIWCAASHDLATTVAGLPVPFLPAGLISVAIAQANPASSRAMATQTTVFGLPARISLRCRRHSCSCAFQAMSRISFGRRSCCKELVSADAGGEPIAPGRLNSTCAVPPRYPPWLSRPAAVSVRSNVPMARDQDRP